MNIIRGSGQFFARNQAAFPFSSGDFYTRTAHAALRCFSEKGHFLTPKTFPLHQAVKEGNICLVATVLKTTAEKVNELDKEGELPILIAVKQSMQNEAYPKGISSLLQEYGACRLLENSKGESAEEILNQEISDSSEAIDVALKRFFHLTQALFYERGCGLPLSRCTNKCREETQEYLPEFKASVALESLTSGLSIEELAKKHRVQRWEVIKWRWMLREGSIGVFHKK